MIISLHDGYELDDDRTRVDHDALWDLLGREAYWGRFRTREVLDEQVAGAWRVVAAYDAGGALAGFARAVADGHSLGYLADVVVEPAHRGRGIGRALARELVEGAGAAGWRWMLHTRDAHSLYARLGFRPPDGSYLERPRSQTPDEMPALVAGPGVVLVATFAVPAAGVADLQAYEDAVLPLLREHGGRLERRLRNDDATFETHVLRFPDAAAVDAYRADARRLAAADLLASSGAVVRVERVTDATLAAAPAADGPASDGLEESAP